MPAVLVGSEGATSGFTAVINYLCLCLVAPDQARRGTAYERDRYDSSKKLLEV